MLSYTTEMLKKVNLQMNAHFSGPGDPVSIIRFLATFKLACDTNHIHEGAAL